MHTAHAQQGWVTLQTPQPGRGCFNQTKWVGMNKHPSPESHHTSRQQLALLAHLEYIHSRPTAEKN